MATIRVESLWLNYPLSKLNNLVRLMVLLPIIAFFLFFFVVSRILKNCWRSSALLSALLWAVILTAITESLSLFKLLSFGWVVGCWVAVCVALCVILFLEHTINHSHDRSQPIQLNRLVARLLPPKPSLSVVRIRVWLLGICTIVLFVGLVALIAPPNTNDSMGYHMPRVMHWIQNHTVAHFPTNYTAQLFLSPWSTFGILHFQILSGSDRFANLIQWFSMIGSIVGVSLIAQQLGANLYGQLFASVFCATLPMGILQGSSTQNDYVVAFWLVCLVYYILLAIKDKTGKTYWWQIGLSLGLATFAKPTAYLYSFPFLLWLAVEKIKLLRWQILKPVAQVAIVMATINGLHWLRNLELFHHPLGKSPDYIIYTNRAFSIPILLSNIVRNIALHLSTPSPAINQFLLNQLSLIHTVLGVDINDPRTSSSNFQLNSLINHEDLAGNSVHLLLIGISIASLCLVWRKNIACSWSFKYFLCIVSGFILFCLILAWTPFHTRLHLSFFVLSSAFVGSFLSKNWSLRWVNLLAIALLISAIPWLLFNETRPLIANGHSLKSGKIENIFNTSRDDLYFMGRRYFKKPMIGATNFIKSHQCSDIGIVFDKLDIYEYPLWALLNTDPDPQYRIQHIDIHNVSEVKQRSAPFNSFSPCIIIDAGGNILEKAPSKQSLYTEAWFDERVKVLVRNNNG